MGVGMMVDLQKHQKLGLTAKVLMELHLKDPKRFNAEHILDQLRNEYERLGLEPMEEIK